LFNDSCDPSLGQIEFEPKELRQIIQMSI